VEAPPIRFSTSVNYFSHREKLTWSANPALVSYLLLGGKNPGVEEWEGLLRPFLDWFGSSRISVPDFGKLISNCGKIRALDQLLTRLKREGSIEFLPLFFFSSVLSVSGRRKVNDDIYCSLFFV
jgi:hypothetical protein